MSYKYDHRQLADEMEIYILNESIGAGLPLWLSNGVALRDSLEAYMKKLELINDYQRVSSPHLAKSSLYQASGHLSAFGENMYPPMKLPEGESEYFLKPMNCPHHHKIFDSKLRSYRELPLRIAEFGQVYRLEKSGSLRGISRVRGLCQNDGHIYVDPKDSKAEIIQVIKMHEKCYRDIGISGYHYRLSIHDPENMSAFHGPLSEWNQSVEILKMSLQDLGIPFVEAIGEAAFYGPKIDIQIRIGQSSQESISSIQLDFNSGEKFGLKFVSSSGEEVVPWVIHRAPLGSHERFIAMLLEFYDGQLPGWLSPIQVLLMPMNELSLKAAKNLARQMKLRDIRVEVDQQQGSLAKRLVYARKKRPFIRMVLGEKEILQDKICLEMKDAKFEVAFDELIPKISALVKMPECETVMSE